MDRHPLLPAGSRAGHGDVRRHNLEVVLRHLAVAGTDSRASIAARTTAADRRPGPSTRSSFHGFGSREIGKPLVIMAVTYTKIG